MHSQNILIIDDSSENITYRKTDISDECKRPKLNWHDFFDICKRSQYDIFGYDTTDIIRLVTANNEEIPLCNYKVTDEIVFIKFIPDFGKNYNRTDTEILIDVKHYVVLALALQWENYVIPKPPSPSTFAIDDISETDPDGYKTCMKYLERTNNEKNIDIKKPTNNKHILNNAIKRCTDIKHILNDVEYQGFLPSIRQMQFINDMSKVIRHILLYTNTKDFISEFLEALDMCWWTSTEAYDNNIYNHEQYAYAFSPAFRIGGRIGIIYKINEYHTFPIFKRMN